METLAIVGGSASILLGLALGITVWYFRTKLLASEACRMAAEEVARASAVVNESLRVQLEKVLSDVTKQAKQDHQAVVDAASKANDAAAVVDLLNRVLNQDD